MIGISSCTEQEVATVKDSGAQVALRAANPPCYDAPTVSGVIIITSKYKNAQGECCVTFQFNPPFTEPVMSSYEVCLTNTASGVPLSPPECHTFGSAGGTHEFCFALTGHPIKITVLNTTTNKIVTCDTYGKECD